MWKRQWNRTVRKRTTDDEDGRKAREIPGAMEEMARTERKENRTKENQKQAETTITTNTSVLQCVTSSQLRDKSFVLVIRPTALPTSTDLCHFCVSTLILNF